MYIVFFEIFIALSWLLTETEEELMLKQALEMSMNPNASEMDSASAVPSTTVRDFSMMTEEEQLAYAMQMSMGETGAIAG